jgi:hypothetical protein
MTSLLTFRVGNEQTPGRAEEAGERSVNTLKIAGNQAEKGRLLLIGSRRPENAVRLAVIS